ncbi:uncharacterized protein [Notothenia coriiceps]|uniref:SH3 domain-containing protein n=1 Tax=Notothenia coriiceps TaxID=8208 RepID=A0A6I9MHW4_9TELE|nr:PREDICTED: uncharacterized protein LOC104940793 [Notothenia coriiceps]
MLRGKLRILQADSTEVNALFMELSTHLISINSEENIIFVTFKTFEEIWKFTTYYTIGFLGRCMEDLLLDQRFCLSSLEEDIRIQVSIQEETLSLIYKGILMQEGSFFASCSTNQMFDSSTSGGDLYLEQGEIAQFEPPFLGSGWTMLCLADGGRGTAPRPAVKPVMPFYQWFLKSCAEGILVGDGKPSCDFPLQFARGTCLATMEYDAGGPDELSMAPGDRIIIVGLLVSCFEWFTGRKEATGEVGLVKTSLVEPSTDITQSEDIFLDGEERTLFSVQEDKVIEETTALLQKKSQNDTGQKYKLGTMSCQDAEKKKSLGTSSKVDAQTDLKRNIQRILDQGKHSSPGPVVTVNGTLKELHLATESKNPIPPCFTVHPVVEGNTNTENFIPLLSLLEGRDYRAEFGVLYGLGSELLASSIFTGHSDEDELIAFLGVARETARKKRLYWPHTRLCFLLGKLCAGRLKFSQARVYLEEALSVPREGFTDLRLLASIYSRLVPIYLLQKNTESFFALAERLVALLFGIPDCLACLEDNSALKYILKKAVLSHNQMAEARACYQLAKHHLTHAEGLRVVPYLERLLVLSGEAQRTWGTSPSQDYLTLGRIYSELQLPHLSVSSARRASLQPSATLTDCLSSMALAMDNVNKLYEFTEQEESIPPKVAPYLHQALSSIQGEGNDRYHVLGHRITVCLSQLFCKNSMVGHAICRMHTLINNNGPSLCISVPERNSALIWLAWLHIDNHQPDVALDVLDLVLASMPEHCTTPQEGVVLNMRGVALRYMGDLRRAAESYQAAVDICQEYEDMPNWAVAQANLGLLCLKAGAKGLAQRHLTEAVQLFSELEEGGHEADFITVLLELGQHYVKQQQLDFGKGCYEWALLLAINANLLDYTSTYDPHPRLTPPMLLDPLQPHGDSLPPTPPLLPLSPCPHRVSAAHIPKAAGAAAPPPPHLLIPAPPKLTSTATPALRTYSRPILPSKTSPTIPSSPVTSTSLTNGNTRPTPISTPITPFHTPASPPGRQVSQVHPAGTPGLVRANQSASPVRQRVSQQTLLLGKGLKGCGQDQVLLRAQMLILTSAMRPALSSSSSSSSPASSSPLYSNPASAQLQSLTLRPPPPGVLTIPPSLRLKTPCSAPPPLSRPHAPIFPPLRPRPQSCSTETPNTPSRHLSVPPPTLYSPVRAVPLRPRLHSPNGHRVVSSRQTSTFQPIAAAPVCQAPPTRSPLSALKSCPLTQTLLGQSQHSSLPGTTSASSHFERTPSAARQLQIIALSSGRQTKPCTYPPAALAPPTVEAQEKPSQSKRTLSGEHVLPLPRPLIPSLPKNSSPPFLLSPASPPQTQTLLRRGEGREEDEQREGGRGREGDREELRGEKDDQRGKEKQKLHPEREESIVGQKKEEEETVRVEEHMEVTEEGQSDGQKAGKKMEEEGESAMDQSESLHQDQNLDADPVEDEEQKPVLGPAPEFLQPGGQEDFSEDMSTQSDNQSALSSLSSQSPPSSPFISPSGEPHPPLLPPQPALPTDLSQSQPETEKVAKSNGDSQPPETETEPLGQSGDESENLDQSLSSPWEPGAWPEGRQVLTHLVEGFVIQEGLQPFPVNRSSLLVPARVSTPQEVNGTNGSAALPVTDTEKPDEHCIESEGELGGDAEDPDKSPVQRDRTVLHCQFCGKRGHAHNFMRSKRFCSTSCARGFNVRLTKRLRALSAGSRSERPRPALNRAESVPGKPLLLRLPRDLWSAGRREKEGKEKATEAEEDEEEEEEEEEEGGEEEEEMEGGGEEEEDDEGEEDPAVAMTARMERRAARRARRASAPPLTTPTPKPTSTFRPPPTQWSVEEVTAFIHTLPGCSDVAEAFRLQEIDGQALLLLTEDHLMTSMNIKLGPALKICAHINTLKNQ